jgi:hypothetical protein
VSIVVGSSSSYAEDVQSLDRLAEGGTASSSLVPGGTSGGDRYDNVCLTLRRFLYLRFSLNENRHSYYSASHYEPVSTGLGGGGDRYILI